MSRASITRRWIVAAGACAAVAAIALWTSGSSRPPAAREASGPIGAYRPTGDRGALEAGATGNGAGRAQGKLTPELEARLRAAAHVETVPASSAGAPPPLPPEGPLPPEVEAARRQSLAGWQREAQQLLDECVARPAAQRQPVPLSVFFAPAPPVVGAAAAQRQSPVSVSMPPQELQRLWRDTDPDGLQRCLDRVRTLALAVPASPEQAAQALPPAMEVLLMQI